MALSMVQARALLVAAALMSLHVLIRRLATAWAADCEVTSLADGDCSLCQGGGDAVLGSGGTLTLLEETPVMEVGTIPNFLRRVYATSHPATTYNPSGTVPRMVSWNSPHIDNTDVISSEAAGVFTIATTGLYRVTVSIQLIPTIGTHDRIASFIDYNGASITPCNLDFFKSGSYYPVQIGFLTASCTRQLTSGDKIDIKAYGSGTALEATVRTLMIELL